ncbi:MAG TPA: hypothetical protein VLG49_06870 [Rhabdochlamydiaceae bacterium]|nr:hypothetical protein [Rhabdochlamydiaceae bacterium]
MGCRVSFDQIPKEQKFMHCEQAQTYIRDVMSMDALSPKSKYVIEKLTIEKDRGISGTGNSFTATYKHVTYLKAKELIDCASQFDNKGDFQKCTWRKIKIMDIVNKYARQHVKPHE